MRIAIPFVATALIAASLIAPRAAFAASESIRGVVTDGTSGQALADVCVELGPVGSCWTRTDAAGRYLIDLVAAGALPGGTWELIFSKAGYQTTSSGKFVVNGPVTFNQVLMPSGARALCPAASGQPPTRRVYLPNITKTLGGPGGWYTPFIVQNTGSVATTLEVTFYRFLTGGCAVRRTLAVLSPGTSYADVPNNDLDLPGDTQFAVVVRSFGADVVAVVNEHAGSGARSEAMSYSGVSAGANSVFLPNVVRRFFGFTTPFIIQNLGAGQTTATARFVSFDGSAPTISVTRTIAAGASKFIDPDSDDPDAGAPGLLDGKQYAVTVTSPQPVSVVVNTHNDAPSVAAPVAYSTNGIVRGGATIYGPYAAKNAQGVGRYSTVVVQNLSQAPIRPTLSFTPLGGGNGTAFTSPTPVEPGRAWAFDPRFTLGTTTPCSAAGATCLGDGEYSFIATSGGTEEIAVAVNVHSPTTAMGYTGIRTAADSVYLPNVTRRLGGASGWTTPIVLQSTNATSVALSWFRFSDGKLVLAQNASIPKGGAIRIDPRDLPALEDGTQYAVVASGVGGQLAAIVTELAAEGDGAMAYEGFAK